MKNIKIMAGSKTKPLVTVVHKKLLQHNCNSKNNGL